VSFTPITSVPPRRRRRLGDLVERLAKPVAVALKLPCLQPDGALKPDSPCAKRRDALNQIGEKKG
jgi:hypothetical protein